MRTWLWVLVLTGVPMTAMAQSAHTVKLINDTRSSVVSFWIAPTGTHAWTRADLSAEPIGSQWAAEVELHGGQECVYDFRTTLSDGRIILADGFNVCLRDRYRVGRPFRYGHPGTGIGL